MFRNQYDSDVTTWSPQGRLFQLEYAMEAVKQGSATVGLKSNKFAIICALKRAQNDLCDHQTKILPISQHCGMSMSGLTSDGRNLCNFMRQECLNEEFVYFWGWFWCFLIFLIYLFIFSILWTKRKR